MTVAKQLHQLQEIDLGLESNDRAQRQIAAQLGESKEMASLKTRLAAEEERLEESRRQQRSAEWEIDGVTTKITANEGKLYGGTIKNPKELANFQRDVEDLKARRDQLEETALEIMDRVDLASANIATMNGELKSLETEWQSQQRQLSKELEELKTAHSDLESKRQLLADGIEPHAIDVYQALRKQKGTAIARVEQGMCRGCQIVLPSTELQHARSGRLVRCSSCGRILFLA